MENFNQEQDESMVDHVDETRAFGETAATGTVEALDSENETGEESNTIESESNSERKFNPTEARRLFEERKRASEEEQARQEKEREEAQAKEMEAARERFNMEAQQALDRIAAQDYKGAELLKILGGAGQKVLGWQYSDDHGNKRYLGEDREIYAKFEDAPSDISIFEKDLHAESKDFISDSDKLAKAFPLPEMQK